MTYRQFGVMVPKSSILVYFRVSPQALEREPVVVDGLAREGILIFWSQDHGIMVLWYYGIMVFGVMVPWYYDVLVP